MQTCDASLHHHIFKLFFTPKQKFWVFADRFCNHFNARGLTNRSKSWIQLRSNNVDYHFCFLIYDCRQNLLESYKRPWSSCFRGSCRKKTLFTRKFWGLCTHWSSILRPPKHWIVFFLAILNPKAVIYPCSELKQDLGSFLIWPPNAHLADRRKHALGKPTSQLTDFSGLDNRVLNFSKFKLL